MWAPSGARTGDLQGEVRRRRQRERVRAQERERRRAGRRSRRRGELQARRSGEVRRIACGHTVEVVRNDEDGTLERREWHPPRPDGQAAHTPSGVQQGDSNPQEEVATSTTGERLHSAEADGGANTHVRRSARPKGTRRREPGGARRSHQGRDPGPTEGPVTVRPPTGGAGGHGRGPLTTPREEVRTQRAATRRRRSAGRTERTDRTQSGVGSDEAERRTATPRKGREAGRARRGSEPTPSLETRRRPRWSRRQMPATAGHGATGRTSRAHIAPHPPDWEGARRRLERAGDAKAEEVERREIGRQRTPLRSQTRNAVGATHREDAHQGEGAESGAR